MSNAPYVRGSIAKAVQSVSFPISPRILRGMEEYRMAMLTRHDVKMSRADVMERALLDFLKAQGISCGPLEPAWSQEPESKRAHRAANGTGVKS